MVKDTNRIALAKGARHKLLWIYSSSKELLLFIKSIAYTFYVRCATVHS